MEDSVRASRCRARSANLRGLQTRVLLLPEGLHRSGGTFSLILVTHSGSPARLPACLAHYNAHIYAQTRHQTPDTRLTQLHLLSTLSISHLPSLMNGECAAGLQRSGALLATGANVAHHLDRAPSADRKQRRSDLTPCRLNLFVFIHRHTVIPSYRIVLLTTRNVPAVCRCACSESVNQCISFM